MAPPERSYAHVPLWRKLGIAPGSRTVILGAPPGLDDALGTLPDGVDVRTDAGVETDVLLWFPATAAELARLPALQAGMTPAGGLWVAWPKRQSRVVTDLDFDAVQRAGLDAGLVDNKVCSVDAVYTALRFVTPRARRPPAPRRPARTT